MEFPSKDSDVKSVSKDSDVSPTHPCKTPVFVTQVHNISDSKESLFESSKGRSNYLGLGTPNILCALLFITIECFFSFF